MTVGDAVLEEDVVETAVVGSGVGASAPKKVQS